MLKNDLLKNEKLEINKDFSVVYVEPILHSKYRFVANILYLLMHDMKDINPHQENIFPND